MDELTVVGRHGDEFGPLRLEPPAAVTEQALAGFRTTTSGRPQRRRVAGRAFSATWRARRPLFWSVPAVAATVLAISVFSLSGGPQGGPSRSTVNLDARSILLAAAAQARAEPVAVPDARQYVYNRFTVETAGPGAAGEKVTSDSETWLAVDGGRPGLEVVALTQGKDAWSPLSVVRPVCPQERPVDGRSDQCGGSGYVTDLPEDPAAALAVLRQPGRSLGWTGNAVCQAEPVCAAQDDVSVVMSALAVMTQRLMPAGSRAAIFEGLSTLSGAGVIPDATAGGRSGVGLVVEDPAQLSERGAGGGTIRALLVFDRTSHDLVGYRLEIRGAETAVPVVMEAAAGSQQVVKELGMRPDGTRIDPSLLTP